jgi:hypothetical protein
MPDHDLLAEAHCRSKAGEQDENQDSFHTVAPFLLIALFRLYCRINHSYEA